MRLFAGRTLCLGLAIAAIRGATAKIHDCLLFAVGYDVSLIAFEGEPFYQTVDVHPYNLNWPATPVAVVYPTDSEQIASTVRCAAKAGYKVQARSGGHSYGNYCLGGGNDTITVDLRNFKGFSVDLATNQAAIGAGMLLRELDEHLHDAGRTISHGTCPDVGIGGQATIGGLSPSTRTWGSTLDHIVGAEIVLANGSIIYTSDTQHPDVLFAVKGAAASFGIVTEFTMRTEPEPPVAIEYSLTHVSEDIASRAHLVREWMELIHDPTLPYTLACSCLITNYTVHFSISFFGSLEEFTASGLLERIPGSSNPNATIEIITDWSALLAIWAYREFVDISVTQLPFYERSFAFTAENRIPTQEIDTFLSYIDNPPEGVIAYSMLNLQGGKINDIPGGATAFAHRDILLWIDVYVAELSGSPVSDPTYQHIDDIGDFFHRVVPGLGNGVYPGHVDPRLHNAQEAYWGRNLRRLERIKTEIDPDDVFQNAQSVRPSLPLTTING